MFITDPDFTVIYIRDHSSQFESEINPEAENKSGK